MTARNRRRTGVMVGLVLASVIGVLIADRATPKEDLRSTVAEAFASLLAALLAVAGSQAGRTRGRERKLTVEHKVILGRGEGLGLLALSVAIGFFAWLTARWLDVSTAAVCALAGAVIGITLVDALHDMALPPRTSRWVGSTLMILAVVAGFVFIVRVPDEAEAAAAIAAAVLTVGGAQWGHAHGFTSGDSR